LTCQRSQFQAYRPPTHWTRPSVRLAHATKFHASPRSSTLDVGRAAGLPTRSLCVAENKATRTYQIGSKRIFFSSWESRWVTRVCVRNFLKASPKMLEWSSTGVKCHVPPEAIKGVCEMISKSVQPIFPFAHEGALRNGPLFCGNRPLGAPQGTEPSKAWTGDPPQGKGKAPLDVRRGALPEYCRRS